MENIEILAQANLGADRRRRFVGNDRLAVLQHAQVPSVCDAVRVHHHGRLERAALQALELEQRDAARRTGDLVVLPDRCPPSASRWAGRLGPV